MSFPIAAETPPIREDSGVLRVGQTGVTLETVLWAFQQGATPEDIVDQFPTLVLADAYNVIAYYLRHRNEVDEYLVARERHYQETTASLLRTIPETRLQTLLNRRRRQ